MFDKITVDMLKTILQSAGKEDVFNRRMSTVDYDNYDDDDYDVFYTDDNILNEDSHDKNLEPNIIKDKSRTRIIPDEAFINVLYTMAVIGITADKYNELENATEIDDNLITHKDFSQERKGYKAVESLHNIVALPLVSDNLEVTHPTKQSALNAIPTDENSVQLLDIYNLIDSGQEEAEDGDKIDILGGNNEEVSKPQDMRNEISFGLVGLEADHPFNDNLGHLSNTNQIHVDIEQNLYF